nr:lymphoid-restricted membrane protein-like isoform X1 [Megalopta genalis]XP_033326162.1 lymphoid-restricted membrane protein-like isoform X1 [Megalopta genalis]
MDESVAQKTDCHLLQSSKLPSNDHQNSSPQDNNADLLRVPKRKLSVFCRSFDVIEAEDQEDTLELHRTSSNPTVRLADMQDEGSQRDREASPCRKGFVNTCRSLIENGKFVSNPSHDSLNERPDSPRCFPARRSPVMELKLPRVREDIDNCSTINEISEEKQPNLKNGEPKSVDKNVANSSTEGDHLPVSEKIAPSTSESTENDDTGKNFRPGQNQQAGSASDDLAKIKDLACPPTFVDESSTDRGKYIAVGTEMSNHEDTSIGSESGDETMNKESDGRIEETRNDRSRASSPLSIAPVPGETDSNRTTDGEKTEDLVRSNREKRQRLFAGRRSLSEGDCKRYHRARRHCGCSKQEELVADRDQFPAFPSFTDSRLQSMGFTNFDETNSLCRENLISSESELERKYIAFSIGLGTDRITLQRRVAMSQSQRDLSEQNFAQEIQKLQEEIENLSRYSLYTDRESMERLEKVRHRLDIVKTCAYKISSAAETLGAVLQEQRISPGIYIADKYLQILRSRCENLSTEIAEIKRILLMHNIVIEEDPGEIYDVPLQASRYRNGSSLSNRTMMARRRASIATISRPLTSQDVTKDCPRQRNSVAGRVTIRRPSWCSEMIWENDKQVRKDSSNSVGELRDISEQIESRRSSREENNNLLRHDQVYDIDTMTRDVVDNINDEDRSPSTSTCLLESRIIEKQLVSCVRTVEPLRITSNFQTWRPGIWYMLFFFLGFYVNYITLSVDGSKAGVL